MQTKQKHMERGEIGENTRGSKRGNEDKRNNFSKIRKKTRVGSICRDKTDKQL